MSKPVGVFVKLCFSEGERRSAAAAAGGAAPERGETAAFSPVSRSCHLHDLWPSAGASHGPYLDAFVSLRTDVVRSRLDTPTAQVSVHLQDG